MREVGIVRHELGDDLDFGVCLLECAEQAVERTGRAERLMLEHEPPVAASIRTP